MNNPLLDVNSYTSLPPFSKIEPSHVQEAVEIVISENKKVIDELCESSKQGCGNDLEQLQEIDNKLSRVWSPVSHLNSVMNNKELREAYTRCLPLLSDYETELGQNKKLYSLIQNLYESDDGADKQRSTVLSNMLKNFKSNGVDLKVSEQLKFKKLNGDLSKICSKYSDNVLDATNAWTKVVSSKCELTGLSENAMDLLKVAAEQHSFQKDPSEKEIKNGKEQSWLITLDFPIFNAVMTYADKRELRKEVYSAFTTRASDQNSETQFDNAQIMEEILALRTKRSSLLNFENYAEQSLYKKMADNPEQVIAFLNDLLLKAKPQAEKEIKHLAKFAYEELSIEKLEAWDLAYVSEKLQNTELDYSEEDIKPWFSVESVLTGLFNLVEKLYGYTIKTADKKIDVWHKDVRYYEIKDKDNNLIAGFYLDLFARQHKRGGAWMDSYRGRYKYSSEHSSDTENKKGIRKGIQTPVAYMTCNSSPATAKSPALFTHNEVITLFHEFGHGLHHMLSKVDYLGVSGINGVEWDAVELPSQFMENWCWQRESLDMFARHYETNERIPNELFEKMLKTRHFNSALAMVRQLEFALFDMKLHMDSSIKTYEQIANVLDEVRQQTSVLLPPASNRFQNSFSHIFSGGYAAGYYSYKWAEVLSADVFSRFEETGLFDKKIAQSFLHEVLEQGGARPAKESFIAFMQREPDVSALLKHSGIKT